MIAFWSSLLLFLLVYITTIRFSSICWEVKISPTSNGYFILLSAVSILLGKYIKEPITTLKKINSPIKISFLFFMCGLQWEFIVYIITVKFPADKYKTGGHPIECPPAVRYLAPRLNLRFAFFCSRSCASRRFASSTARSTSSGPKARLTRSKSATAPRRALFSNFVSCKRSDNRSFPSLARPLTALRPSKAHLRPTGWSGGVAPAVCGRLPQQGCPLKRAPTLTLAVGQGGKAQPFPPPGQCPPWAKSQGVRVVLPCGNLHPQVCPLDFWPRSP